MNATEATIQQRYPWSPTPPRDITAPRDITENYTDDLDRLAALTGSPISAPSAKSAEPFRRPSTPVLVAAGLAAALLVVIAAAGLMLHGTNGKLHTTHAALTKSQGETTAARSDTAKALGDKAQIQNQLGSVQNELTTTQRVAVYVRDVDVERKAACSDALDLLNQEWLAAAKNIIRGLAAPAITEAYKTKLATCLQAVPGKQT